MENLGVAAPTVSVILATLNENANLPILLDRIGAQLQLPFEIVVVDDGSTDGTREYLAERSHADPRLRLIFHDKAQTLRVAQCAGIEQARGTIIVIMDADLQHPPEVAGSLVSRVQRGAALVIATRYGANGTPGKRPAYRALLSIGAEFLARVLLRNARRVSDPMSGLFAFDRGVYPVGDLGKRGNKLLLTLLAMSNGSEITEVGYHFENRMHGSSKITHNFAFLTLFVVELLRAKKLELYIRRTTGNGSFPEVHSNT